MFLKIDTIREIPILTGISIYAFYINWVSGNIGIIPIDSFGFLDSSHSILNGKLPIRDFWIFTGLLVDYMGAFFLSIFGNNWNSYLFHSSFMNIFGTTILYFFLKDFKMQKKFIVFYCLSFATLCYPVSGTPFAYIHAFIFSLISAMILILAIKNQNRIIWFCLPFLCIFSFLSMQTPSAYILLIIFFISIYYFIKTQDVISLKYFIVGCVLSVTFFIFFMVITKTPFINFLYQYILFPITIGEGRLYGSEAAYLSFFDQINFKRLIGDFKFIHIFFIPLIFLFIYQFKKKNFTYDILNVITILSVFAFLFSQLITANQIYIFSLIPFIAAVLHLNLVQINFNFKAIILILLVVLFSTTKFHIRYNIDRKFHELEKVDKTNAIAAKEIHQNLKNLKWISSSDDPNNESRILKKAINVIKNDNREKTLITHYHFISTVLDKNLNILNRWYLWDDNTHPTENHKYFNFYKLLVNRNIQSNNVKVIYLLGQENEIQFDKVKNYFNNTCFESKTIIEKRFSVHEIVKC